MISRTIPRLLRVALGLFAVAILIPAGQAATLRSGDIIVVDVNSFGGRGGVIKVDPITGAQEVISSAGDLTGGLFSAPRGCAIDAAGQIIVADDNALGGGGLIRIDPMTGSQTAISSGGFFVNPRGVTANGAGSLIVADAGPLAPSSGSIIKVDPTTGAQTLISSGGFFVDPHGVAIDAVGDILVSEQFGAIIRVDPVSGAQSVIAFGGSLTSLIHLTIDSAGNIIVASRDNGIIKVNPTTGGQAVIASGLHLVQPNGVAMDASGNIVVADGNAFGGPGGVIRVDPASGSQTVISPGGFFVDPQCVAVVPPLQVFIDIKPGSDPNSINLGSGGTVPVAILSTSSFDATTVNPSSITLAGAQVALKGKGTAMTSFQDVNGDGLLDQVVHVTTEALQLSETDTEAVLEGETFSGLHIRGTDSVRIVP